MTEEAPRRWLREASETTWADHPFEIDAWVLLPDHLHCIWSLPEGDGDYATTTGRAYIGTRPSKKSIKKVCRTISEATSRQWLLATPEDRADVLNRVSRRLYRFRQKTPSSSNVGRLCIHSPV